MAIKKDTLDGLLAGVTRRLFSPRTAYSTSSRKLWRNDPEGPALDPSENTIDTHCEHASRTIECRGSTSSGMGDRLGDL